MNDPFQMQPELRYGAPFCDQLLTAAISPSAIRGISARRSGHWRSSIGTVASSLGRMSKA